MTLIKIAALLAIGYTVGHCTTTGTEVDKCTAAVMRINSTNTEGQARVVCLRAAAGVQ